MPRLTGLNAPKYSFHASRPSQACVIESPRKMTSPSPLLLSMRSRNSLCRALSRGNFVTAGFAFSAAATTSRPSTSTDNAANERLMMDLHGCDAQGDAGLSASYGIADLWQSGGKQEPVSLLAAGRFA